MSIGFLLSLYALREIVNKLSGATVHVNETMEFNLSRVC